MKIVKLTSEYSYKIIAFDKNNKKFVILEKSYNTGWIIGAWKIKEKFLNDKGFKEILEKESKGCKLDYIKRFKKLSSNTISRLFEDGNLLPWICWFCRNQEKKVKEFYYHGNLHFEL